MNKFLLSFGLIALLAGCDKPAENKTTAVANEMNKPAPAAPVTPAEPVAPAAPVTPTTPENRAVEREGQTQQQEQLDTNTMSSMPAAPPAVTTEPNQADNDRTVVLNPAKADVIDASSEEAMTASLDKMIVNLSESEKEAFAEAFLIYAMSKVDMSLDEATNQKNMLAALNGKSVNDIMTEADKIRANSEKSTPTQSTNP